MCTTSTENDRGANGNNQKTKLKFGHWSLSLYQVTEWVVWFFTFTCHSSTLQLLLLVVLWSNHSQLTISTSYFPPKRTISKSLNRASLFPTYQGYQKACSSACSSTLFSLNTINPPQVLNTQPLGNKLVLGIKLFISQAVSDLSKLWLLTHSLDYHTKGDNSSLEN